jgi:rhodanese-related sulfurtransferase
MTETMTYNPTEAQEYFARKVAFTTGPVEVNHQIEDRENINIVDVRAAEDYEEGHLPGAVSLPKDRWDRQEVLRKDMMNILYCYSPTCHLAAQAAARFAEQGFPVMEMEGGFETWREKKLTIAK